MRTVLCAIGLLAAICSPCLADSPTAETQAVRTKIKTECGQLALVVSAASEGKSTLMLDRITSANPSGYPVKALDWGDTPFVQVCPVSEPFKAVLGKLGEGTVLGAVALLEVGNEGSTAGAYLVFGPHDVIEGGIASLPTRALLVQVKLEENGKVSYIQHLEAKEMPDALRVGSDTPKATVTFSGLDVDLRMWWKSQSYAFRFRPSIIFV